MSKLRRALVFPDVHIPYYSIRAWNLMLEIASHLGVDEVVGLGDLLDCYPVSRHRKDPRVFKTLLQEIETANKCLDQIDESFPSAKKILLMGNHEQRLEHFLCEKAPELFGITDIQSLLTLPQRGWKWIGFGRDQAYRVLGSDLFAFHRPKAVQVRSHIQKSGVSSVYGDVHKIEQAHAVALDGKHLVGYCPGWLGEVRHRVFDYMPSTPQWQLGFSFVTVQDSSKEFHHEIIEIKNNKALYNGKIFKG